ncbi:MAG: ribonuclease HII [Desulfonatronovibrionaceae bacterium]
MIKTHPVCHENYPPGPVAGIDEAGRGCLAGPVAAAAVILPEPFPVPGLTDSKKLSPGQREHLAKSIKKHAAAWSIGLSWPSEIDRLNILQASLAAMVRAVKTLKSAPVHLLIDGNQKIPLSISQQTVIRGDVSEPCISAASILAKTFRDRLMAALDRRYPGYNLAGHKGYGTREHLLALRQLGPCPMHRMTFKGVRPVLKEFPIWLKSV